MLERVDCRSFSSDEIFSTVALAASTCARRGFSHESASRQDCTHGSTFKGVNGRGELGKVVGSGLEFAQDLLGLLDSPLVPQDGLVSSQVDFGNGGLERGVLGSGSGVSGSESAEFRKGFYMDIKLAVFIATCLL